jgi:type II secretory pathway pseudopilin PulG
MKNKILKGQSMFEVLFALGMIALITVAIVSVSTIAIRNNTASKNKSLANKYVSEFNEWLRIWRDTHDWTTEVLDKGGDNSGDSHNWCAPDLPDDGWIGHGQECDETDSLDYIPGTVFLRGVTISRFTVGNGEYLEAAVYVKWNDSQGWHEARSVTNYTDWQ